MCGPVSLGNHVRGVTYGNAQLGNGKYYGNVTFECDAGYVILGFTTINCDHPDIWSPFIPTCEKGNMTYSFTITSGMDLVLLTDCLFSMQWRIPEGRGANPKNNIKIKKFWPRVATRPLHPLGSATDRTQNINSWKF